MELINRFLVLFCLVNFAVQSGVRLRKTHQVTGLCINTKFMSIVNVGHVDDYVNEKRDDHRSDLIKNLFLKLENKRWRRTLILENMNKILGYKNHENKDCTNKGHDFSVKFKKMLELIIF